ncbi:hypothetical protein ACFW19_25240 [Streptomyces nigra]|uniref:hypothetical protein n=1 Tax=Streptomyces nigra TaxID=1827580 RepID=UPI0036B5E69A
MTTGIPSDLATDVRTCKDFRDRLARAGVYAEIEALRTRLQFTLGRYQEQALELERRGEPITTNMQALVLAAQVDFAALREAEDLLAPEEALLAALAEVDSAAQQLVMGVFHEMEEVGRDGLVAAAHRLAAASARASKWRIENEQRGM